MKSLRFNGFFCVLHFASGVSGISLMSPRNCLVNFGGVSGANTSDSCVWNGNIALLSRFEW